MMERLEQIMCQRRKCTTQEAKGTGMIISDQGSDLNN